MKYGLITYQKKPKGREYPQKDDVGRFNIGDNIQMLAIRRIYIEEMNAKAEDIIEIDFHELSTYKGEYLLVLINLFFFGGHDLKETWFPASPYIIPIFAGIHFSTNSLTEREISYFRSFAPIGCRDEFTLRTMRLHDINAYLFGCVSATFPKRNCSGNQDTIFLVDVDDEILSKLPEKYQSCRIEKVQHVISGHHSEKMYRNADEQARLLLDKYARQAALVITSRLHCASPCAAMGIPTIMVVKEKSQRFSWLSNILSIYSEDEIDEIDWEVNAPDFEGIKSRMIEFVKNQFHESRKRYEDITTVSDFYERAITDQYVEPFHKFYKSLHEVLREKQTGYYLWGGTALAEEVFFHISEKMPDVKYLGLIDEYNKIEFQGKASVKFQSVLNEKNIVIIVTPTSSIEFIKSKLLESSIDGIAIFSDGTVLRLDTEHS